FFLEWIRAHIEITSEEDVKPGIWKWKVGDSHWKDYDKKVNEKLEEAFRKKKEKIKIDDDRYVDLKKMRQVRYDNEKNYREVKRVEAASTKRKSDIVHSDSDSDAKHSKKKKRTKSS